MSFPSGSAQHQRVLEQCNTLATFSALPDGILRAYLTPEHLHANQQVSVWMQLAGMTSWQDAAGNIVGRYAADDENAPILLLGSHLDTVPYSGKYDGIVGVLAAIEVVKSFHEEGIRLPFHVDVIGFADEEGVRFRNTLLGSRAAAGQWLVELWDCKDDRGVRLDAAFNNFGLDPLQIGTASYANKNLLGYWELHIEQGPVLEFEDWPVGVVTGIAGARRFAIEFTGMAGHAGTVPMAMRQDALVAAAKLVTLAEKVARKYDIVATVGQMDVRPGGVNIIPGAVRCSLDIRSADDAKRDKALAEIQKKLAKDCDGLSIDWEETHNASAVGCDPAFQALFADVIASHNFKPIKLASGAGHDAMMMANICPVGMIFMRCKAGISHHPAEMIYPFDTQVALNVLRDSVLAYARAHS